jgi:DNA invertase Pin-like site-specific DNA recombinase
VEGFDRRQICVLHVDGREHVKRGLMSGLISYVRVSTTQQGKSGLGLAAQQVTITRFAEAEGRELIAEFVEVESGKGADALNRRPKLAAAIGAARKN